MINELSAEEHRGRTFAEVIPHLAPVLEPIARRVLETGEPVTALEMSAGTPSDPQAQRFWLSSYYPVLAADGEALGVGAVVEEVTDRRRAEQRTELQHAVTMILSVTDPWKIAVSKELQTVCEALAGTSAATGRSIGKHRAWPGCETACMWRGSSSRPGARRSHRRSCRAASPSPARQSGSKNSRPRPSHACPSRTPRASPQASPSRS